MSGLIEHLESHLGEIDAGWQKEPAGNDCPFHVLKFKGGPIEGSVTVATLGISNIPLVSANSGKTIRQELLFMTRGIYGDRNIPSVLQELELELLGTGNAILRGQVIGPRGPLFHDSTMEALYVTIPVYLPRSFQAYESQKQSVTFAWLVPITCAEQEYICDVGWEAFEDRLQELDPDLLDLRRESIV
jgi:hypothetical protein